MNVLFICTGNSARSLIAEAVFNARCAAENRAYSAGSRPAGRPNPIAIRTLERAGYETATLRSKSWDEFSSSDTIRPDLVITLCNSAAAEECPVWIGSPEILHWGLPDPAAIDNPDARERAFQQTLSDIEQRIAGLIELHDSHH